MKIRYDKYDNAEFQQECYDTQWERYLKYLMMWILDHRDNCYEGMSPACYDEFCDNDDEVE